MMMPGGAGGSVAAWPAASGSSRLAWAVKLPETLVSTCSRPPSLTYERVTPCSVVIAAVWPASSVADAPVEPPLDSDELPVTIGTMVVPTMLSVGERPPLETPPVFRLEFEPVLVLVIPPPVLDVLAVETLALDETSWPYSPLAPPAVLPALAGRMR